MIRPLALHSIRTWEEALQSFRSSVHAWSAAVYNRPRPVGVARLGTQSLAACGGLGPGVCFGGRWSLRGILERHHRQEVAMIAAQREAERQKQIAVERAREEEDLLAKVDSDVSRQVPSAMEPLALLLAEDETR